MGSEELEKIANKEKGSKDSQGLKKLRLLNHSSYLQFSLVYNSLEFLATYFINPFSTMFNAYSSGYPRLLLTDSIDFELMTP